MVKTQTIHKYGIEKRDDFLKAQKIAEELQIYLSTEKILKQLEETHHLYANSGQIQAIVLPRATELGFKSEKKGLFNNYSTKQLRPDYYLDLGDNKGIIMEVERGKTIANNMDLLDLWKCHICSCANFLFLIVPKIRQTDKGNNNTIFNTVSKRIGSFFDKENYTNVDAVFIFGY